MGSAALKRGTSPGLEIRIRFEPGLGAALYASLHEGQTEPLIVARMLGRGKALLHFHGVTLMAHGAPEWRNGESFPVTVKELGPPMVLAPAGRGGEDGGRVTIVDSAVVPGSARASAGPGNAPGTRGI